MPTAHVNGIDIEYVTEGDPSDPPLLLVMGLGAQLITWPQGFVDGLRERGFFVIRFDNRDCGLSTKFEGLPDFAALFGGDPSSAPYLIEDMADDAAALLDRARHRPVPTWSGASMGGMITQALVDPPPRALPLRLLHHVDHRRPLAWVLRPGEAITALLRPLATSREEAIEASLEGSRVIGSPGYPTDESSCASGPRPPTTARYCPEGTARQLAAILGLARPHRGAARRATALPGASTARRTPWSR